MLCFGIVGLIRQDLLFVKHLIDTLTALATKTLIAFDGFKLKAIDFNRQTAQIAFFYVFTHDVIDCRLNASLDSGDSL